MKKILTFVAVIIFLTVTFSGCIQSTPQDTGKEYKGEIPSQPDTSAGTGNTQSDDAVTTDENNEDEIKTDTGRYVGLIDSNSIEIKISGVPDEMAARAFRLDDWIKEEINSYGLKKDDEIKFRYKVNEYDQPVIIEIEKLKTE